MIERRQFIKRVAAGAIVLAMPYLWLPRKSAIAQAVPNAAFIGAQGHGAGANGWRDPAARILFVTNRNDGGAGSLRAALTSSGARYIIFQVGGRWTTTMPFSDETGSGNYYLAGQTAPGDGVSLTTGASGVGGDQMILRIAQSHVCCRFIRTRGSLGAGNINGLTVRAPGVTRGNVIVDHCSVSWIYDDNISIAWMNGVTFQWCISSESLSYCGDGCGGRGMLMVDQPNISNISVHHTYFAHNQQRNPDCNGIPGTELINILTYNCGTGRSGICMGISNYWQQMTANVQGCCFKWGPSTTWGGVGGGTGIGGIEIDDRAPNPVGSSALYVNDNKALLPVGGLVTARENGLLPRAGTPFNFNPPVPITVHAASDMPGMLNQMGAIKPKRDAIDQSVVDSYAAYTRPPSCLATNMGVIANETDTLLGGFPAYNDPNNDTATHLSPSGMTDEFITRMGLANTVASALSTSISQARGLGEPYQNIEWCLMEQAGDIAPLPRSGSAPSPARLLPPGNLRQ